MYMTRIQFETIDPRCNADELARRMGFDGIAIYEDIAVYDEINDNEILRGETEGIWEPHPPSLTWVRMKNEWYRLSFEVRVILVMLLEGLLLLGLILIVS